MEIRTANRSYGFLKLDTADVRVGHLVRFKLTTV